MPINNAKRKYKAVLVFEDKEVSPIIYFTAKSIISAKRKATIELVADHGTWQEWIQPNQWCIQPKQWKKVVIQTNTIFTRHGTKNVKPPKSHQVEGASIILTDLTDLFYTKFSQWEEAYNRQPFG